MVYGVWCMVHGVVYCRAGPIAQHVIVYRITAGAAIRNDQTSIATAARSSVYIQFMMAVH
jgi:hypothetical protein